MIPLTDDENRYSEEQKKCYICRKAFCDNKNKKKRFKLYKKVRDHCHFTDSKELLMSFVTYTIKYPKKSCKNS